MVEVEFFARIDFFHRELRENGIQTALNNRFSTSHPRRQFGDGEELPTEWTEGAEELN